MNGYPKTALIFASLTLAFSQAASAAAPPNAKMWNGAWHLNAAKSKFASPAKEQSETRTYTVSGGKIAMKSSSKDMSGKTMNFSYSAAWDGKYYPMTGNPNADRISLTAVRLWYVLKYSSASARGSALLNARVTLRNAVKYSKRISSS